VAVLALLACSKPVAPTGLDVPRTGTYTGAVRDIRGVGGDGVATLVLHETGSTSSGTWLLDLSRGAYRRDGTLAGQTTAGRVNLVMRPAQPHDCTFQIEAVTAPDDRITGMWVATSCTVPYGGTIEVQRR
jgi:hypothetical protein